MADGDRRAHVRWRPRLRGSEIATGSSQAVATCSRALGDRGMLARVSDGPRLRRLRMDAGPRVRWLLRRELACRHAESGPSGCRATDEPLTCCAGPRRPPIDERDGLAESEYGGDEARCVCTLPPHTISARASGTGSFVVPTRSRYRSSSPWLRSDPRRNSRDMPRL
jgi:hypothetical protein